MRAEYFVDPDASAECIYNMYLSGGMTTAVVERFRDVIHEYYSRHRRDFPWRDTADPYCILVSEVMLQQTQTERVRQKYIEFIDAFPDFTSLAKAHLEDVLRVWRGMGYNRRAIALRKTAERVVKNFGGTLPCDIKALESFPGIGKATARSIVVFAFNKPEVFIETNIRSVFIHFFFRDRECVSDAEITPLIEATLHRSNAHHWYSALMDYGVMLKKETLNPSRRSRHHRQQSKFEGSDRQVRGMILRAVIENPGIEKQELYRKIPRDCERVRLLLDQLQGEGFICEEQGMYRISK